MSEFINQIGMAGGDAPRSFLMPDKHEFVVAQLRVGPLRCVPFTDKDLDDIAAILRREYGDDRRNVLEEAAEACDKEAERWERGFPSKGPAAAQRSCAAAIRKLKEEADAKDA